MEYHKYHLERYHGVGSRHECPSCHDKRSFAYYVDDNGNILDKTVGRCNHESSCGYHYTPKQWFMDHPSFNAGFTPRYHHREQPRMRVEPVKPDFINPVYVEESCRYNSCFDYYLSRLMDSDTLRSVWIDYEVGATVRGAAIFWQIDKNGNVRTGKVIKYDPKSGHRIKDGSGVNWVHAIMKKRGLLPDTFHLVQCLFGEHLLAEYPDKSVALVEAEKTALVGACVFPQYVWVATGGKSQMNPDKMRALQGRRVIAFPDVDGFNEWKDKAKELARHGIYLNVSDVLERNATPQERERKIDIADWILQQLEQSGVMNPTLERLMEQHPAVGLLVDKLKLRVV